MIFSVNEPKDIAQFHRVVVAVGSNMDAVEHIAAAQRILNKKFSDIRFSQVVETEAIGIEDSPPFRNFLAVFSTTMSIHDLDVFLKGIELTCGREPKNREEISLDIDLLSYDGIRYHVPDWDRSYIRSLFDELNAKP